jgi:CheY-like chemotaxis protein
VAYVLLADDNDDLAESAAKLLRMAGHQVVVATNGGDAVKRLAEKPPPDLMILDMGMPVFNGHQVLKTLGPSAPPVIIVSGTEVTPEEATHPAVRRVLSKSLGGVTLLEAVDEVLRACRPAAQAAAAPPPECPP